MAPPSNIPPHSIFDFAGGRGLDIGAISRLIRLPDRRRPAHASADDGDRPTTARSPECRLGPASEVSLRIVTVLWTRYSRCCAVSPPSSFQDASGRAPASVRLLSRARRRPDGRNRLDVSGQFARAWSRITSAHWEWGTQSDYGANLRARSGPILSAQQEKILRERSAICIQVREIVCNIIPTMCEEKLKFRQLKQCTRTQRDVMNTDPRRPIFCLC
jgi:hypothetical protein